MDQEDLGMIDILIFAVIYALLAAGNLIRLVKGPTGADRMVAADSMDILGRLRNGALLHIQRERHIP